MPLILFVFLSLIHLGSTQTFANSQSLRSDLLTGYVTSLRPGSDQSVALNVSVALNMVLLKEFDEVTSSFTFVGYMTVMWTDHRFVWTAASYGNLGDRGFHSERNLGPAFSSLQSD